MAEPLGGVAGWGLAKRAAALILAAWADQAVLWWRCWEFWGVWGGWGGEQRSLGVVPVLLPVVPVLLPVVPVLLPVVPVLLPVVPVLLGGVGWCLLGSPV